MRLLHLADVHLDRPFVGLPLEDARARRRELRGAFDRCLELAAERGVDVITVGGDLWEDEHVTPDTVRWVRDRLAACGLPVVLIAGNHDRLAPGGPYERADFADPVIVVPAGQDLTELRFDSVSIWGMSWSRDRPLTADALTDCRVPRDDRHHVLLLHGTCGAYFDGTPHCPFTSAAVRAAGFDLCLAGHLHAADVQDGIVIYPGSPEPLGWSETGRHAVAVGELAEGIPSIELVDVATRRYVQQVVDCTGADSSADIERRVLEAVETAGDPEGLCLRLRLTGRVVEGCSPDTPAARETGLARGLTMLDIRDETAVDFDLDALAAGRGLAAVFVERFKDRLGDDPDDPVAQKALELGLRALHGEDL